MKKYVLVPFDKYNRMIEELELDTKNSQSMIREDNKNLLANNSLGEERASSTNIHLKEDVKSRSNSSAVCRVNSVALPLTESDSVSMISNSNSQATNSQFPISTQSDQKGGKKKSFKKDKQRSRKSSFNSDTEELKTDRFIPYGKPKSSKEISIFKKLSKEKKNNWKYLWKKF